MTCHIRLERLVISFNFMLRPLTPQKKLSINDIFETIYDTKNNAKRFI